MAGGGPGESAGSHGGWDQVPEPLPEDGESE
jgi:hypothetical protein